MSQVANIVSNKLGVSSVASSQREQGAAFYGFGMFWHSRVYVLPAG